MDAAREDATNRKRPEPSAGDIAAQELARRSREQGLSEGLTTAGISAHSTGLAGAPAGCPVYAAVFVGAIAVKVRYGQVASWLG